MIHFQPVYEIKHVTFAIEANNIESESTQEKQLQTFTNNIQYKNELCVGD
jgi:hypothetical protein